LNIVFFTYPRRKATAFFLCHMQNSPAIYFTITYDLGGISMTRSRHKKRYTVKADKYIFLFVSALLIGLFIKNAALASEYVREALLICVHSVIPSVFPCAVSSSVFVSLGGGRMLGKLFRRPLRFIFGLSENGAAVLLLGWLCGFPIGAITGATLLERGELSRDELDRLLLFSGIPCPAFVISAVGENMLGDRRLGIMLWLSLIVTSVIIGIFQHVFIRSDTATCPITANEISSAAAVGGAIRSSGISMLNICANIVFFSVLTKLLISLFAPILRDPAVCALFCGFFELSGGCAAASALPVPLSAVICGFILGWSGLGVHFQIISAVGKFNRPHIYFAVKLVQGLACAFLMLVFTS
jgi:sporulation integral membrane protein YlbJ